MPNNPKLFAEQKVSTNQIQRALNLDKMCLYRYIGNYEKIKKMPCDMLLGIANYVGLEPNDLYNKMLVYAVQNKKGDGFYGTEKDV